MNVQCFNCFPYYYPYIHIHTSIFLWILHACKLFCMFALSIYNTHSAASVHIIICPQKKTFQHKTYPRKYDKKVLRQGRGCETFRPFRKLWQTNRPTDWWTTSPPTTSWTTYRPDDGPTNQPSNQLQTLQPTDMMVHREVTLPIREWVEEGICAIEMLEKERKCNCQQIEIQSFNCFEKIFLWLSKEKNIYLAGFEYTGCLRYIFFQLLPALPGLVIVCRGCV